MIFPKLDHLNFLETIMKTYDDIGIQIPRTYLPRKGTDLAKWSVIACDQFTSEPEYWQEVENIVGNAPSTYHLILPEVFLGKAGEEARIKSIQDKMHQYLQKNFLIPQEGLIYIERTVAGRKRRGIMVCLDLERYDFTKASTSLIRATEGTIVERLPPRMKIRTGAELELPHILVLIDDPKHTVIEPLEKAKGGFKLLYDFDLMLGSGHLSGYAVNEEMEAQVVTSLRNLAKPDVFAAKYGIRQDTPVLLFAMGDGNHSLATAKAVWERMKPEVGLEHPARYALIELENVHDEGLDFKPIHRLLFGLKKDIFASLKTYFGPNHRVSPVASVEEMVQAVDKSKNSQHLIGLVGGGREFGILEISHPSSHLPVGTIQEFLDQYMNESGADKIDYLHGEEIVCKLGLQPGNAGFYVPAMDKSDLFKTVILDGALPRKTFSMGEARGKRFYMEARKIV
jgi:hypothetical protein